MSEQKVLLSAEGLYKDYSSKIFLLKNKRVLQGCELNLLAGQSLSIVGENGSGKTTLLKIFAGLVSADKGRIVFSNKQGELCQAHRIGYMPEVSMHFPTSTVRETLTLRAKLFACEPTNEATLKRFKLWNSLDDLVVELSKGMKRRLDLLLSVQHKPEILILDEPFSGLDEAGKEVVIDFLKEYISSTRTLLLCDHDFPSLAKISENYIVLNQGRLGPVSNWAETGFVEIKTEDNDRIYEFSDWREAITFVTQKSLSVKSALQKFRIRKA